MARKIIRVWTVPESEHTSYFEVDYEQRGQLDGSRWTVGEIEEDWEEFEGDIKNRRFYIYDTNGKLQISLPTSACGASYETGGDHG